MKNIITTNIAGLVLAGALVIPTFAFAQEIPPATGSGSTVSASATGAQSTVIPAATGAESTTIPAATGSQSTVIPGATGAQSTTIPGATGAESTVIPGATGAQSTLTPAGTNGGNNGGNGSGPVSNGNPTSTGSSGSGTSVGSGGSSGGGVSLPTLTSIAQCSYLGSYVKTDKVNNVADVIKLQNFLKNTEGMNVTVTGAYDAQTIAAVNAFQVKYSADVLAPWGVTTPTSQVYYTTSKKINEIFCKTTFSLTPAQLAEITAYRTAVQNGSTPVSGTVGTVDSNGNVIENPTGTSTNTTGSTTVNTNVGAAADAPIFSKIWNFIKRIFGR